MRYRNPSLKYHHASTTSEVTKNLSAIQLLFVSRLKTLQSSNLVVKFVSESYGFAHREVLIFLPSKREPSAPGHEILPLPREICRIYFRPDVDVGKGRWCRLSKEDADAEKLSENVRAPDTDGALESGIGLRTRYSSGLPLRASAFLNGWLSSWRIPCPNSLAPDWAAFSASPSSFRCAMAPS